MLADVPSTMMALRAHTRGGPEVLVHESAPVPVPAADEVLVEVHAAAITFAELTWPETWFREGVDRTPVIPAHEVSGVVVAAGGPGLGFEPGDEVYGLVPLDHPRRVRGPAPGRADRLAGAARPRPAAGR
jgi:NADPH:quinone reductase-like Zn-dependent oxidoreductase